MSDYLTSIKNQLERSKMVGTIEMKMIKENDYWKIDSLEKPKFEKLALPQVKATGSTES